MEGKKSLHVKAVHSREQGTGCTRHLPAQRPDASHSVMCLQEAHENCDFLAYLSTDSFHVLLASLHSALPIGSSVLCSGRCPALLSSSSDTGCWVAMGHVRHAEGLHLGWRVCREGSVSVGKRRAHWDGTSFAGFLMHTTHCTRNSRVQAGRLS